MNAYEIVSRSERDVLPSSFGLLCGEQTEEERKWGSGETKDSHWDDPGEDGVWDRGGSLVGSYRLVGSDWIPSVL